MAKNWTIFIDKSLVTHPDFSEWLNEIYIYIQLLYFLYLTDWWTTFSENIIALIAVHVYNEHPWCIDFPKKIPYNEEPG